MPAAPAIMAAAAVASAAMAYSNGQAQKRAADRANQQAEDAAAQTEANAQKQQKAADEATNRANQKTAGAGAALDAAMQSGKAGASGTMLTGPQGVDPSLLSLGKNTLLGS